MNLTMSVEMTLALFLLCSGFSHFTFAHHLRSFRYVRKTPSTWKSSSNDCNETNEYHATVYDEEDVNYISQSMEYSETAWLGLRKGRNITWSNNVPVTGNISVNGTNEQLCVAIDNTTWKRCNCSERKPFMCYNGANYTLIPSKKSWCQALQHCRIHFDDLVSISNETQNENAIKEGKNTSFWIGLMLDEWEWQDGSCSSFSDWNYSRAGPGEKHHQNCTIVNAVEYPRLLKTKCDVTAWSFCSKGTMRIRVIGHHLTWEQAFDYCKANHTRLLWIDDQEDQKAVEQWLNYTIVSGPFWIGLRQSRVFGFWIWSDSMVIYNNWKNNTMPELPLSNHCGVINKKDGKWRDEDCLYRRPFLCEEEIVFMNKSRRGW